MIYTDGVSEAENPAGVQFGEDRLTELVKRYSSATAAGLHRAIIDQVAVFTAGAPQNDDVTLVVIEYGAN